MALLDFLKRKDQQRPAEKESLSDTRDTQREKKGKSLGGAQGKQQEKKEILTKEKKGSATSYSALLSPHVTEKASILASKNVYVFRVAPGATKLEIMRAVRELYSVPVEKVNIVRIPSKKIRVGRRQGVKRGFKKAMVTVSQGHQIDMITS
ncbi:MAG: 50S ribosomal protein L23 [bacterium]|nr:50S ribosomal protein L23 [bacterium]